MRRNVSLEEISDGRLYSYQDMVKADCHGCHGCHQCCTGMGNSVVLDPYDVWRLSKGLNKDLTMFLSAGELELNVVDGCILPNLKMSGAKEACAFLDGEGRCAIHPYRPGICRLFPLGRIYENGDYRFFLQVGECKEKNRSKVKVSKWIDTTSYQKNHDFLCKWHYFLNGVEAAVSGKEDSEFAKTVNMALLREFFFLPAVDEDTFYCEINRRIEEFGQKYLGTQ